MQMVMEHCLDTTWCFISINYGVLGTYYDSIMDIEFILLIQLLTMRYIRRVIWVISTIPGEYNRQMYMIETWIHVAF